MHVKFYGDRPGGTALSGRLNATGVAKYSNFGPFEGHISETVQDMMQVTNEFASNGICKYWNLQVLQFGCKSVVLEFTSIGI